MMAIVRKEFRRFFTDRRMVLSVLLLPGLMIYLIYSFIGSAATDFLTTNEDYVPVIYAVNLPDSVAELSSQADVEIQPAEADQAAEIKTQIAEKSADLLAIFPEGFDKQVSLAMAGNTQDYTPPRVELYYNSTKIESNSMYALLQTELNDYRDASFTLFTVNPGEQSYDLVTEESATSFMLASLLPMLLMLFLFTGSMSVAPESIVGEKERGTIATLLVTPMRRWELALGKIVSISCIALLSGLSSFIGIMLSLPKLIGIEGPSTQLSNTAATMYAPVDYLMLLAVVFSTVLLFVGLISIISAYAKTVKEANTLVTPLMIVVMLVGVTVMFSQSATTNLMLYLIPAYNSVQVIVGILSFSYQPLFVAITVLTNVLAAGICVFILTRMFNSEKVMFSR
ncbi:MAG: ABC transporter permease [Coriobacteriaceae bacterium]|nr:ABC transporter permease [Coriobacteriaceae bacterium]